MSSAPPAGVSSADMVGNDSTTGFRVGGVWPMALSRSRVSTFGSFSKST